MSFLTYALIALGGALGSVGRAWLGTVLAVLTGPVFPWGTIAINVLGSFVIGFFGTLTATDGRFALPFDARAFVMVGVCGGFTTFSSFSLQTLELLRDNRAGQAMGNVLLSVALCLGSVAAGYSLALAVRTSRLAVAAEVPGAAGGTLVALHRPEAVEGMLAAAKQVMQREDDRITVLMIDGPALAEFQPTEEVLTTERRQKMASWRTGWAAGISSALDRWAAGERKAGHPARWMEIRGDGAMAVLEHGRGAHLLLLEQKPGDATARVRIHAALVRARRPVLLVPSGHVGRFGRVVAVAWQPNGEAEGAVRTALPLLSQAERVVLLQVGTPERDLPALFDGLPVRRATAAASGGELGVQLLAMAHEADADLLVMGSKGGRLRERLFDGTTESLLRVADLPVLMQHVS